MEKNLVVIPQKKSRSQIAGVLLGAMVITAATLAGTTVNAHAALDFLGITLNTADVESVMGLVIPGLAALWGFRKIIKTMNRS